MFQNRRVCDVAGACHVPVRVLPYPVGDRHNVRQGDGNPTNTHNDRYNGTLAYDFEMPIGSEIGGGEWYEALGF